jgi:hypothetical protein
MQQHWRGSGATGNSTNWRQGSQQQPSRDSRQQEVFLFCMQLHFGSSSNHCVVSENVNGRSQLEDLHVRKGDNIKMAIKEIGWESANWIHPVSHVNQWQAVMDIAVKVKFL